MQVKNEKAERNKLTGSAPDIPEFPMVNNSPQDQGVSVRVNTMDNGYAVRTGGQPIFYATARQAADAVAAGIYQTLTKFEETGE